MRSVPDEVADPRRLGACVWACRDIPTEALEADVVRRLIAAAERVRPCAEQYLDLRTAREVREAIDEARGER